MKKLILITISILLTACGSSGSSDSADDKDQKDVNMIIGTQYAVFPGNKIIKHVPDTYVNIIHQDGKTSSIVNLVEGNATIIRDPK